MAFTRGVPKVQLPAKNALASIKGGGTTGIGINGGGITIGGLTIGGLTIGGLTMGSGGTVRAQQA
jgi:hypothetical protein